MAERKYKVMDELGFCLAADMSLDMALLFIKAYCQEYYKDRVKLRLEVMRDTTMYVDEPEPKEYDFD